MQIVVNCETRLCSQFLGPGDNFLQSYGAIFTMIFTSTAACTAVSADIHADIIKADSKSISG